MTIIQLFVSLVLLKILSIHWKRNLSC